MKKMTMIAVIATMLATAPALVLADSAESKRLFNQGQYGMGVIAAQGSLNPNTDPQELAASYFWGGKNQIAKGDVEPGIYSIMAAIRTNSTPFYTKELAQVVDLYAGKELSYYRVCEPVMDISQKKVATQKLVATYLARIRDLANQGSVPTAKKTAEKIVSFDSSVRPALAKIFADGALATSDENISADSATIALAYASGENKPLAEKLVAMSKQIEKANGPFDQRVDKFYQLAQKFDSQIPDNVVQCEFGKKKVVKIPSHGEFTPWYVLPKMKCNYQFFFRDGDNPDFIIYFAEGKKTIHYQSESLPSKMEFVKMKFQSAVGKEQYIAISVYDDSSDQKIASR